VNAMERPTHDSFKDAKKTVKALRPPKKVKTSPRPDSMILHILYKSMESNSKWEPSKIRYSIMGAICSPPPNRPLESDAESLRVKRYHAAQIKDQRLPQGSNVYIPLNVGVGVHMHLMGLIARLHQERRETQAYKKTQFLRWDHEKSDRDRADAAIQEGLDLCGLNHKCAWDVYQRFGIMRELWLEVLEEKTERCCPSELTTLRRCFDFRKRTFINTKNRSPVMLASIPGSGNTWTRMLLEYGSGHFSGSTYDDLDLMSLMPAEGRDDSTVITVKTHLAPKMYLPRTHATAIIFIVRHPFDTMWAEFQRRRSGSHASNVNITKHDLKYDFPNFVSCMSCKWLQYSAMHMQLRQSGIRLLVVKYEELKRDTAGSLRSMLDFAGIERAADHEERIACALKLSNQASVHRKKRRTAKEVFSYIFSVACQVWNRITEQPAAYMLVTQLHYTNYVDEEGKCSALTTSQESPCTPRFNVNASFACRAM